MIPPEITKVCRELAIQIVQRSPIHYHLIFEDSELVLNYWPTTGKIGIACERKFSRVPNLVDYILERWGESVGYSKPSADLNDSDLMPFGMHKGKKLANVPDEYLLWLFDEMDPKQRRQPLGRYISENLNITK